MFSRFNLLMIQLRLKISCILAKAINFHVKLLAKTRGGLEKCNTFSLLSSTLFVKTINNDSYLKANVDSCVKKSKFHIELRTELHMK